jgi:hypothetical protein
MLDDVQRHNSIRKQFQGPSRSPLGLVAAGDRDEL